MKTYTPKEVALAVLRKSQEILLAKASLAGLTPTKITPVPGTPAPLNSNTASPTRVGAQAVVKQAKPKKMGQATDKASQFYKAEEKQPVKRDSIKKLESFLANKNSKNKV